MLMINCMNRKRKGRYIRRGIDAVVRRAMEREKRGGGGGGKRGIVRACLFS